MAKKKKKDRSYGPVSVLIFLTAVVGVLSFLFSFLGWESYQTTINNGTLESSLITARNFFSLDGLKFFVSNAVQSFRNFQPLILVIIVLIGIGICEKSGLLSALVAPFKKVKFEILLFFTFLISMSSTCIGDYSFVLLIPLTGVIYKYLSKNPTVGILTCFLGITVGYGTGLIFNYNDYVIGNMAQASAILDVDKMYLFTIDSTILIMIITTLIMSVVGTLIVSKLLVPKFTKKYTIEEEELTVSSKARSYALLSALAFICIIIYMLIPMSAPGAGILLDQSQTSYIAKILGDNAPFQKGFVLIVTALMMLAGFVYGKISGNIKSSNEYSLGLSKNFENLGFMFVLMFFTSQMLAILDWTNLGNVVGARIVDFLGGLQFSGVLLIITFFVSVILMSFLLPGTIEKWTLLYPTIIPLFMRSNITPEFTMFIYKVADGIGKAMTPLFLYFMIALAFLEKYRISEKHQISVFGTLKSIMPSVLMMTFIWIMLIVLWYIMGLPIGMGVFTTL